MARTILRTAFLVIGLSAVATVTQAGVAHSPKPAYYETWEPFEWQLGAAPGNAIESRVSGANTQSYTVYRWQDTSNDTDFEGCARDVWDVLAVDVAILHVHGHGSSSLIDVATNTQEDKILDPSAPYSTSWTDPDGDGTPDSGMGKIDHTSDWGCYVAYATSTCIGDTHQSTLNDNRAIVHLEACKSADGTGSPLAKCYGRTGFGYTDNCDASDAADNMALLFDLMNGTKPVGAKGTKRKAGEAYTEGSGSWKDGFTQEGADDTTLCPSVESTSINPDDGTSFAEGPGGGYSGSGRITFDTHCEDTVAAGNALQFTVTSGSVALNNFAWSNDYTITFDYAGCDPDYAVTMKAKADNIKPDGGTHKLDGGNSTEDGVAPNGDDYTWTFSY